MYGRQKSSLAALRYLARLIFRRGPSAIRRRVETRRSLARITNRVSVKQNVIKAAFQVHGAIGDNVIAARFLRDLMRYCPTISVDIFSANVPISRWIYDAVPGICDYFQDTSFPYASELYDASFVFEDIIRLREAKVAPEKLDSKVVESLVNSLTQFQQEHKQAATLNYNSKGVLAQHLLYMHGQSRAKASHFIAGIEYGGDRYPLAADDNVIDKFSLRGRPYITVHNGFDVSQMTYSGSATKVYPKFNEVVTAVRKARPEFAIVQIGTSTSTPIGTVDLNLLGQTSIREAAGLVKQASCHLDNEGGFVTIASCYGTPCCVVFGPSNPDYFAYEGNVTVRPVECGGCWWISESWLARCPRGMTEPVCMYKQPPSTIAKGVLQLLGRTNKNSAAH